MTESFNRNSGRFFAQLDKLPAGERTALKRAAGSMLSKADGRAIAAFFRCLPPEVEYEEDRWFAAACFYCMWDAGSQGMPLEQIFHQMKNESGSMESRLAALLDQRWENDGYLLNKLYRLIKMAGQQGYCVDCAALLYDLLHWNWDAQFVQRRWARTMYQNKKGEDN